MNQLDIKRKELELIKVSAAKADLQFRIDERLFEIQNLQKSIDAQAKRETELKEEIKQMKEKGE